MHDSEFWAAYEERLHATTEHAHQIALRVLQDEDSHIDPGLRLDYASSMRELLALLADNAYTETDHAVINTASHGPVTVEVTHEKDHDGTEIFRVFRFDRVELDPQDVSQQDLDAIYAGYQRLVSP